MVAEILSAGLGLLGMSSRIVGDTLNYKIGKENLDLQQQNLDYQKSVQGITWSREDNAVQRRVADLKAAGLNPVLAAGSAANSGPIVSTQAPQRESITLSNKTDLMNAAMNLLRMKQDISTSVAQQKYLEAQKNQSDSATKLNDIQAAIKYHDYDIYKSTGVSSNATGWPKAISDGYSMISNQIKGTKGEMVNKVAPKGSTARNIIDKLTTAPEVPAGSTLMKNNQSGQFSVVRNDQVEKYKANGWNEVKK